MESPETDGGNQTDEESFESFGTEIGRQQSGLTRLKEWVLVEGNRLFVAALLLAFVFVLFFGLSELGIISFANDDSVTRLAGGMIAGTLSLVTLVISINQLILSQEFAAASEARSKLDGVMQFRTALAADAEIPAAPASPTRLLEVLIATIDERAATLEAAIDGDHDEEVTQAVLRYTNSISERTERVEDTLSQSRVGTFTTVSAAVGYNDAWQRYAARHLHGKYESSLSADASEAFEDLLDTLELFATAREHFKTTYLQRELTRFSQLTMYAGVPAILAAMLLGFLYAGATGPVLSLSVLPPVVSALITVVVSPLALLVAYMLRAATITRRTASVGPMIPQKGRTEGPFQIRLPESDPQQQTARSQTGNDTHSSEKEPSPSG